jgi:hypothetical protein
MLKGEKHYQISHPSTQVFWQLNGQDFKQFNGKVSKWFRHKMLANPPSTSHPCWRATEGDVLCDGHSRATKVHISLPVMLIIESGISISADGPSEDDLTRWNYPATLQPDTKEMADEYGVIYDIVGRAFSSSNHFITRFSSQAAIFDYNDMQYSGSSRQVKKAKTSTHLSGDDVPTPFNFFTHAVVYHLRGGAKAQQHFYRNRLVAVHRIHNIDIRPLDAHVAPTTISFTKTGTEPLPDGHRFWMKDPFNTRRMKTTDYTQILDGDSGNISESESNKLFRDLFGDDGLDTDNSQRLSAKPKAVRFILSDEDKDEALSLTTATAAGSSDPFPYYCRCGARGDGHIVSNGEPSIQCDECERWSHIACQRRGRASHLGPKASFVCDYCNLSHIMPWTSKQSASVHFGISRWLSANYDLII